MLATGNLTDVLDQSPTTTVVLGAQAGSQGDLVRWSLTTAVLVVGALAADQRAA